MRIYSNHPGSKALEFWRFSLQVEWLYAEKSIKLHYAFKPSFCYATVFCLRLYVRGFKPLHPRESTKDGKDYS